ncbi:hypothetical protein EW145_g4066 [Phellinidium pouzarii]|uniref:CCHC-type domain-containing protein n=1 Tax=Phellinidium pouzarii TaxID=167371 RepID=A0A4S4LA01_9AGAM|nr:hypothetical protein EW145_g4066 [Phellinidium pouzarii]
MTSPVFFVDKKDKSKQMVTDNRYLNSGTIKNAYPLPLISEIIDKVRGAKYFSKLDLRWGYNNVRIKEGDEEKAAFATNRGSFEPLVMTFGLCNAPSTFQNMMNDIFYDLITKGVVIIYIDDILIFTETMEENDEVVEEVLRRLLENDLFLKPEKCKFGQMSVEFLGIRIGNGEIQMVEEKVQGVRDWPVPTKLKEVESFLGFANFYRRFIKDFSKIAQPLNLLKKKDQAWTWGKEQQQAFDELKQRFCDEPVIVIPNPKRELRIEADASDYATGATGTADNYNTQFQSLVTCSNISDKNALSEMYQQGLTRGLIQCIYARDKLPNTMEEWYQAASQADNLYHHLQALNATSTTTTSSAPHSNCFRNLFSTTTSSSPTPTNSPNRPKKLTPEEREKCMKEGHCLACREVGHNARDCTKYKARTPTTATTIRQVAPDPAPATPTPTAAEPAKPTSKDKIIAHIRSLLQNAGDNVAEEVLMELDNTDF